MKIEQTNIGDIKTGEKNGRTWSLTPCGLKINGQWYNASFFNDKEVEQFKKIQAGDDIDLILYKEKYKDKEYDKFKFPTELDLLKRRVDNLEQLAGIKDLQPNKPEEAPMPTSPDLPPGSEYDKEMNM